MLGSKYRTRITIEHVTGKTADAAGQLTDTWATYHTTWCQVLEESGQEEEHGKQTKARRTQTLVLRYDNKSKDITPRMRVNMGGRYLNIESVKNIGMRNREIELRCGETVR